MLKRSLIALSLLVFSATAISDELPATTDELVPDGSFTVNAAAFGAPFDFPISSFDSFESDFTDQMVSFGIPAEIMADYFSEYSFEVVITDFDQGTFDICGISSDVGMYHCHFGSNAESFGCPTGYGSHNNTCTRDDLISGAWYTQISVVDIITAIMALAAVLFSLQIAVWFTRTLLEFIRG